MALVGADESSAPAPKAQIDPADSLVLKTEFGRNWRNWAWFRQQWTKVSLSVIGGLLTIIVAIGGWAVSLKTRVVVLETEVEPVLKEGKLESNNSVRIEDIERRVKRLEDNLDLEYNEEVRAARAKGLPVPPPRRGAR